MSAPAVSSSEPENPAAGDFSLAPVPEECTRSAWHIALIVVGTVIGIPVFLVSAQIGGTLGMARAVPAFLVGSALLCVLGALTSLSGAVSRYSTYILAEFAFGRCGARFVNFVIAVTLVGWFAVTGNVFGQAADMVMSIGLGVHLPLPLYVILGSSLMIWIAIIGFSGIDRLAFILVPLMILFLGYTNYLTADSLPGWDVSAPFAADMSFSAAASAVVGSYIVGVVIQPDYSRFARNGRHAVVAMIVALGLLFPLVQVLAALPSVATGEIHLIQIMIALGIGVPAFLLLLLGSWSSNVVGLYSSGLSMATIFTRTPLSRITLSCGIIGTSLALTPAQEYFIPFLVTLGIAIPPVAAIYVIDVLLIRRGVCDPADLEREPAVDAGAFFAWGIAVAVGVAGAQELLSFSGVAALDTLLIASCLYLLCRIGEISTAWRRPAREN